LAKESFYLIPFTSGKYCPQPTRGGTANMRLQHQFNQTKPLASWEALICLALWKHFCLRVFWGEF